MNEEILKNIDINDEILNIIESETEEIDEKINSNMPISYKKQKEYENNHWYYRYRIDVIQKLLKANIIKKDKPLNILDIGIGTGTISEILEEYGQCIHIEKDEKIINLNKNLKNVIKGNAPWELNIEENLRFDYIVLFNILEYQDKITWMLDILKTYLKNDGKILITTLINPDKMGINENLYNIKNRFNFNDLKDIFYQQGLKIKDYTFFQKLPTDKLLIELFNKFADDEFLYFNFIPKDNFRIYNYFKEKELDRIGIKQINSGEQVFIKLSLMTEKERKEIINRLEEQTNKISIIDKLINTMIEKKNITNE